MKVRFGMILLMIALIGSCGEDEKPIDPSELIYNGDLILKSQEELDAFGKNNFLEIRGNLTLGEFYEASDISDLAPLKSLERIGGDFVIFRTDLPYMIGLENLSSIEGSLIFQENQSMISCAGLNDLVHLAGDLRFLENAVLTSLNGLNKLSFIGGSIYVHANDKLVSLTGLQKNSEVGSLWIHYNSSLRNLEGLSDLSLREYSSINVQYNPGITSLKGLPEINNTTIDLTITGNEYLTHVDELVSLENIETLFVSRNPNLENIEGLQNLTSVENYLVIASNPKLTNIDPLQNLRNGPKHMGIYYSEGLENLNGLANLESVDSLYIKDNINLKSLEGLSSIRSAGDIFLENNSQLADYCSLKPLLQNEDFTGTVRTINNLYNPTQDEIVNGACSQE